MRTERKGKVMNSKKLTLDAAEIREIAPAELDGVHGGLFGTESAAPGFPMGIVHPTRGPQVVSEPPFSNPDVIPNGIPAPRPSPFPLPF
jgi:hypothetical protein